jgi:hypothetical protein
VARRFFDRVPFHRDADAQQLAKAQGPPPHRSRMRSTTTPCPTTSRTAARAARRRAVRPTG